MNIFKQFFKSIYSPKDIALFRFQGIGKTILYVFFLTLISILPAIFALSSALSSGLDTAKSFLKQAPDFSITNGQLSAETDVPFIFKKDDFTFILDPTGAVSVFDAADEGNTIALLKDEFVFAVAGQTDSSQYAMMPGLNVTKADLDKFTNNMSDLKSVIIPVMSIFIYLFSSAASFIEVSIVALFGLFIRNMTGRKLNYGQIWRMAAYSETLPTLFFTIMGALQTSVPNSFWINWFVVIIVLYLAINEVPKPKKAS